MDPNPKAVSHCVFWCLGLTCLVKLYFSATCHGADSREFAKMIGESIICNWKHACDIYSVSEGWDRSLVQFTQHASFMELVSYLLFTFAL
jgi:hypothetical protein